MSSAVSSSNISSPNKTKPVSEGDSDLEIYANNKSSSSSSSTSSSEEEQPTDKAQSPTPVAPQTKPKDTRNTAPIAQPKLGTSTNPTASSSKAPSPTSAPQSLSPPSAIVPAAKPEPKAKAKSKTSKRVLEDALEKGNASHNDVEKSTADILEDMCRAVSNKIGAGNVINLTIGHKLLATLQATFTAFNGSQASFAENPTSFHLQSHWLSELR